MIQHFVPRVYLKNFSSPIREDYFIDVYDKIENRFFNTNIKNICSEKDLYTLNNENVISKDKYVFEKAFSRFIEPMFEKCYKILTNDNIFLVPNHQRIEILIGLFQFYSRNPNLFKSIIDRDTFNITKLYGKAIRDGVNYVEYRNIKYDINSATLDDILQDNIEQTWTFFKEKHMKGLAEVGDAHQNIIIHVSKVSDNSLFITGDTPMANEDHLTESKNPILKSKEFFISVNEKYCIHLFHDTLKNPNEILRSSIRNASVANINDKIYKQSRRFVMGTKRGIKDYFSLSKRFENISEAEAMDLIEQAINSGPHPTEPDYRGAGTDVLSYYLNLYKRNGDLSHKQFYRMQQLMKRINREALKKRLG